MFGKDETARKKHVLMIRWTLTETGQLRLTYSDNLCLDSGEDGAQLWECVENNDNQGELRFYSGYRYPSLKASGIGI